MPTVVLETIDPVQWARIVALAPWPNEARVTDRSGVAWVKTRGTGAAGGDWTPVDDLIGPDPVAAVGNTPIVVKKTNGDIVLAPSNSVWTDVDSSGTAAVRTLDIVIPNVSAGQWISYHPSFFVTATGAVGVRFDVATIDALGAVIHTAGDATWGVTTWFVSASAAANVVDPISMQLQASDIVNGSVRLRLRYLSTGAVVSRTIQAGTTGGFGQIILEGRGPLG